MDNYINILGFKIYYYSICILLGVISSSILLIRNSKRLNVSKDKMFDIIFYTLIFGIIGARVYYVLFNIDYYKDNIVEMFYIWNGGLAIHGGIIGGFLFLYYYTKNNNIDFIKLLDLVSVVLLLGQAVGRWGNFFNKEAYGSVVSIGFLKRFIPDFIINRMYINNNYHHPTFLYESFLCFIGFIILYILYKKKMLSDGKYVGLYLIYYGIVRIFIEILRVDSLMFLNIKFAIVVSLCFIIVGIYLLFRRRRI